MKKVFTFLMLVLAQFAISQVGIGTKNPQGIFNVDGGKDNATTGTPTATQTENDIVISNNSGNLGIGTISPNAKIDVLSATSEVARFVTKQTTTSFGHIAIGNGTGA